jgi:hypothetical protein
MPPIPSCPNCHQLLPDGNHPTDVLVAQGGLEIPIIICPTYTHDTLVVAPPGTPATVLQTEAEVSAGILSAES